MHSLEGLSPVPPQLNYITNIVLKLKVKLAKIKAKVKKLKNQLTVVHLSLINEVRHNVKSTFGTSMPFLYKYPFQNPKNKNLFPLQDIKIQKEVDEKSSAKSTKKEEKENAV